MLDRPHPTPAAPSADPFALAKALSGLHFIGGAYVPARSGKSFAVVNPATGEVQAKCPLASKAEVAQAVAHAKAAQPSWAATNPQKRARVMMKFVNLLHRDIQKKRCLV